MLFFFSSSRIRWSKSTVQVVHRDVSNISFAVLLAIL